MQMGRVSLLYFSFSKWDPYPFFYRLEEARYLDKPSAMHGREFQLTHPELCVPCQQLSFFHAFVGTRRLF
jgi:hypothetical protein